MILSHAACMCDVSNDFKRILIFDAATGAAAVFRRERERERETTRVRERFYPLKERNESVKRKRRRRKNEDGSRARALSLFWRERERSLRAVDRAHQSKTQRERAREYPHFIHFFSGFHAYKKGRKKKRKFLTRARSESSRNDARANTETPGKRLVRANVDENYPFLSLFFCVAFCQTSARAVDDAVVVVVVVGRALKREEKKKEKIWTTHRHRQRER